MADGEGDIIDPQEKLRTKCGQEKNIMSLYDKLQECNGRVSSRSNTVETCTQELFDYVQELDHCVSHSLFKSLK